MIQHFHSWIYIPPQKGTTNLKRETHLSIRSSISYNSHDVEAT